MTLEQAGVTQCELACESEPANHDATGMDMPCAATASEGKATITVRCDRTISFGDQRGCCAQVEGDINGESWLVFAACD
jgi:hypothetical protein